MSSNDFNDKFERSNLKRNLAIPNERKISNSNLKKTSYTNDISDRKKNINLDISRNNSENEEDKIKDKIFYERWQSMRQRTTNPNLEHADCYINRGINSDEFKNFIDFYDKKYESFLEKAKEIGKKNTSLERIDPNLDYTSENTTWIHKNQQQQNCRKTVDFAVEYPDGNIEIYRCLGKFITEYNNNPDHKIKLDYNTALDCMNNKITNHRGLKFIRLKPGIEFIK